MHLFCSDSQNVEFLLCDNFHLLFRQNRVVRTPILEQIVQMWPKTDCVNSKCVEICVELHYLVLKKLLCVYVLAKIHKKCSFEPNCLKLAYPQASGSQTVKWEAWHRLSNWASFVCINVCRTHRKWFKKNVATRFS